MPFTDFIKFLVDKKVGEYCEKKIPVHIQNKVRLSHKVRDNSVTLFEDRTPWERIWWSGLQAKSFSFATMKRKRYGPYIAVAGNPVGAVMNPLPPVKNLDRIFEEIDDDSIRIFGGYPL